MRQPSRFDGGSSLSGRVDLLFSDAVLPGKTGLTLARLVRARRPDLPIALVTGWEVELRPEIEGGAEEDGHVISYAA